jgi:hypothetical protein
MADSKDTTQKLVEGNSPEIMAAVEAAEAEMAAFTAGTGSRPSTLSETMAEAAKRDAKS